MKIEIEKQIKIEQEKVKELYRKCMNGEINSQQEYKLRFEIYNKIDDLHAQLKK